MANTLDCIEHIRRASLTTNDPEVLTHIYGAARSLARTKALLVDWKSVRLGTGTDLPEAITERGVLETLSASAEKLEETLKMISNLKTHIEARKSEGRE